MNRLKAIKIRFLKWLYKTPVHRWFRLHGATFTLPGFNGIPVFTVLKFFFREIQRDDLTVRAAGISFNFMLALFPFIIFLFTLIPYLPLSEFQDTLFIMLSELMPRDAYTLLFDTIKDVVSTQRSSLLYFVLILALYFSSNAVNSLMTAFQKNYPAYKRRTWIGKRLLALWITVLLSMMLILSVVLIIAGNALYAYMVGVFGEEYRWLVIVINAIKWIATFTCFFTSFALIYYLGPTIENRLRVVSVGAMFGTLASLAISIGFSYYVNNFAQYNKFYGSMGTMIAAMIWIYLNASVLLIGFELNASISLNKEKFLKESEKPLKWLDVSEEE